MSPLSTMTVWSSRNIFASASNTRTFVNATAPAGVFTSAFASAGACADIAFVCASVMRACSDAYCSGSQLRKNEKPKNLPLASAQIGIGKLVMPVIAQAVISFFAAPSPTVRVVSFSAFALPPGNSASV